MPESFASRHFLLCSVMLAVEECGECPYNVNMVGC